MAANEPALLSADAQALLAPWTGPCGGLPPYDRATPAVLAEGEGPDTRPWRCNSTVVQRAWAESCTQEVVAVTAATPRPSPLR